MRRKGRATVPGVVVAVKRQRRKRPEKSVRDESKEVSLPQLDDQTTQTTPVDSPIPETPPPPTKEDPIGNTKTRELKFNEILSATHTDLDQLRRLSWSGIPPLFRADVWRILLGYLPASGDRREITLTRKRNKYVELIPRDRDFDEIESEEGDPLDRENYRQILLDLPRTVPTLKLLRSKIIHDSLKRVLYIWAHRHPASGYVQGMSDLVTTFFVVFICDQLKIEDLEVLQEVQPESLSPSVLLEVEADCYWCLTKMLDGIQDNYTVTQDGIQRMLFRLKEILTQIDSDLVKHLEEENFVFMNFFRWMNCLLMRELPLRLVPRMWDTYFAEEEEISNFHVYVCAAFLIQWAPQLKVQDFQDMMTIVKNPPTTTWTNSDIEMLLSKGYMYQTLYHNAPSHFK